VKSGDKPPYFIGLYRGGFGNPFDVTTKDKQPLAGLLQRDLAKELQALGYTVVAQADAARTLDVAILDWKFDAMLNGKFWYVLDVRVLGRDGQQLVRNTVQDSQYIEGSFWTGAKSAVEAKMPELYAGAIRRLVRENPSVSAALAAEKAGQ
jgi:CheY-like chemotaxis protein